MSKYIGRRVSLGIARETTRGTYVAPTFWLPHTELSFDDKTEKVVSGEALGVINDASEAFITSLFSQGSMSGEVRDRSFGLLLYAMLGSVSSVNTDGAAWTHTFSLAASNQHASLSLVLVSPDETVFFRRCMLQAITITYELGGYVTFEAEWMAHASEDSAVQSASFSVENKFVTRMASVRFAANIAGLGAASETSVKRARITISKNLVRDDILGTIEPEDILNQQFGVEGELELNYENTTVKDFMTANTYRALRINAVDTNTTIGGSSNPTFRLDLPRVHFFDWEPQNALNEIRRQTVSFKGLYDLANSQNAIHQAVLINTATGY